MRRAMRAMLWGSIVGSAALGVVAVAGDPVAHGAPDKPAGNKPEEKKPDEKKPDDSAKPSPPTVFQLQLLVDISNRMNADIVRRMQSGDVQGAETLCRKAIELVPFVPTAHYNLACIHAVKGEADAAFQKLDDAIERGFTDAKHIAEDADFAKVRELPRFAALVEKARQAKAKPPAAPENKPENDNKPENKVAPRRVENATATVDGGNTAYVPGLNLLHTLFAFDEPKEMPAIITGNGEVGDLLRAWHKEGTAAGNWGDLYDNCDREHSPFPHQQFPQLARIRYAESVGQAAPYGLQRRWLHGNVTFGNSSTASVGNPFWRSNTRAAYANPETAAFLHAQYRNNQLYFYPEHQDHDPGHNGGASGGYGDVYPANTPYVLTSQGSSGSDQAFMHAVCCTLSAFPPQTKKKLVEYKLLMPAVQMVFRMSNKNVGMPAEYRTGKAHPSVFDASQLDVKKMITMAHAMRAEEVPPLAQLTVVEEDKPRPGRDYFHTAAGEALFDTPCAIARVARGLSYWRRMVVSAEGSLDANQRPLTFHWVVLRGDPARVEIKPQNEAFTKAEIKVAWHPRRPIEPGSKMESNRVDIGVFAYNGAHYSPPSFVSISFLDNEVREYDDRGALKQVTYRGGTDAGNYADPAFDIPKSWRDVYAYDAKGALLGWTRHRGEQQESFTADGAVVTMRDARQRPLVARTVSYAAQFKAGRPTPVLEQTAGNRLRRYRYRNDDDLVGEIAGEEPVEKEPQPEKPTSEKENNK